MGVLATEIVEFRADGLQELRQQVEEFHVAFAKQSAERDRLAKQVGQSVVRSFTSATQAMTRAASEAQYLDSSLREIGQSAGKLKELGKVKFGSQYSQEAERAAKLIDKATTAALKFERVNARIAKTGTAITVNTTATPTSGGTSGPVRQQPGPSLPMAKRITPDIYGMLPVDTFDARNTYSVHQAEGNRSSFGQIDTGKMERDYRRKRFLSGTDAISQIGQRGPNLLERAGNSLSRAAKELDGAGRTLRSAVGVAAGVTAGIATKGFQGTVEGERFGREFELLARELAGAFKPMLDFATRKVRDVRQFMEGLDKEGQNRIANLAVAGGVAAAGGMVARRMGIGGAVAGKAVLPVAMIAKLGEEALAVVEIARGNQRAKDAFKLGIVEDNDFDRLAKRPEMAKILEIKDPAERRKAAEKEANRVAKDVRDVKAQIDKEGFRGKLRAFGNEMDQFGPFRLGIFGDGGKAGREIGAAANENLLRMGFLRNILVAADKGELPKKIGDAAGANPNRNMVTLAQAGYVSAGSTYEDLQTELAKTDTGRLDPVVQELRLILLELQRQEAIRQQNVDRQQQLEKQIEFINKAEG